MSSQVEVINTEINQELSNETVSRALLATTFKGLNAVSMKQALMEGMIRGYTFKDFLEKNVYAIPYGSGYSLLNSIDYNRKVGARSGVNGKSAPTYTERQDRIETCSITVFKKGGHPAGYTATVYFAEYDTGKNLWKSKPRTMIAKVAEMHALRMACPEELSQAYIEEEMEAVVENGEVVTARIATAKEASKSLSMGALTTTPHGKTAEEINAEAQARSGEESQDGSSDAEGSQEVAEGLPVINASDAGFE